MIDLRISNIQTSRDPQHAYYLTDTIGGEVSGTNPVIHHIPTPANRLMNTPQKNLTARNPTTSSEQQSTPVRSSSQHNSSSANLCRLQEGTADRFRCVVPSSLCTSGGDKTSGRKIWRDLSEWTWRRPRNARPST